MSKHLFGIIATHHGTAANNRGESTGNITTLQKILWKGEVHTTVSAEAIRFAIRWYWQRKNEETLHRRWNDEEAKNEWWKGDNERVVGKVEFSNWQNYLDDDVLGFMSTEAAKEEGNDAESTQRGGRGRQPRGTCNNRRGRLEVTRAISLTPFAGDITFNAASRGATPSASSTGKDPVPYGTEMHATRFQYGFALTPEDLYDKKRALDVVDALVSLCDVAGNHGRFLFDFSPESVIFRWTDDFAPRILYGFALDKEGHLTAPEIVNRVNAKDIEASELIIGGSVAKHPDIVKLGEAGSILMEGVKAAAEEVKERIKMDLGI